MKNIFIMGSGRSGTSLAAGLFSEAGYFMGNELMPPTEANSKGYFESFEIEKINESILRKYIKPKPKRFCCFFSKRPGKGQFWLTRLPLKVMPEASEKTKSAIRNLLSNVNYCFKDPRFSYTLPVWRPFLRNVVFLCIFREPARTANSIRHLLISEPYLQDFQITFEEIMEMWKLMYKHILERHILQGEWLFLHYNQLMTKEGLVKLEEFTERKVNNDFPDQKLSRSKNMPILDFEALEIYQRLCRLANYNLKGEL